MNIALCVQLSFIKVILQIIRHRNTLVLVSLVVVLLCAFLFWNHTAFATGDKNNFRSFLVCNLFMAHTITSN